MIADVRAGEWGAVARAHALSSVGTEEWGPHAVHLQADDSAIRFT
jgi:hypothetical protein